ncbi:hypothetical protein KDA_67900 [Dictyobacter alpinus]|uniref:F5/8 type C domain-containing protein n=1 Tax=Dictyobacter alpinus TaxID=2014873 RepID=A0A402BIZ4_9CHLR|nr:discoidin domain-containing protein [Dictyobacter alpinus]GCE31306.1 hypothetical protein KDA_67900 [Dictyobacter alpinus]
MNEHAHQRMQGTFKKSFILLLAFAMIMLVTLQFNHIRASASGRDPLTWPFASTSIWNMPIGDQAQYAPANIPRAANATPDPDWLITTTSSDPVRPIYQPGSFGPGRCSGTTGEGSSTTYFPDNVIVPDATSNPYSTPNNAAAIVQPDGHTLVQVEPLARCSAGGNVYGYQACGWASRQDLKDDGLCGGHFGSGLSSIGGMVRLSELQASGDNTIPHALQLEIWDNYLYACNGTVNGFRWPASRADSGACDSNNAGHYKGNNPNVLQGSLLALPTNATPESLGITTDVGRKLFTALQNYGGYIVDDTGWDDVQVGVQSGVEKQYDFDGNSGYHNDIVNLFSALQVITNNSENNIGGGGTLRAPMAPDFSSDSGNGALDRTGWSAKGTSSNNLLSPLDGEAATRWTTEAPQTNNQYYQIDMGQNHDISQVVLDSTQSPGDYPRQYILFLSTSNNTWGNAVASGSGDGPILTLSFSTQSARYITIQQTGSAANWWSIHELNVYP